MKALKLTNEALIKTVIFILFLFFQGCACANSDSVIKGNGEVNSYIYEVSEFNSIEIRGMFTVLITQSDTEEVFLDIDSNLHELINVEVKNNKLIISTQRERFINPTQMGLHISFIDIDKLILAGATKLTTSHAIKTKSLTVDLSGATSINMEVEAEELTTKASGASNILYSGKSNSHFATMSGAGKLQAENLFTEFTKINFSGAGSATVNAKDHLNANMSGVGSLYYLGDPEELKISRSGIGRVRKL